MRYQGNMYKDCNDPRVLRDNYIQLWDSMYNIYFAPVLALLLATGIWFGRRWRTWRGSRSPREKIQIRPKTPDISQSYNNIEPLQSFDWEAKPQIENAGDALKSAFHLTMALRACTMSELIDFDNKYKEKILLRRHIIAESSSRKYVMEVNPVCAPAVAELYEWMFGTYLPKRYPTMFSIVVQDRGSFLLNRVFNELVPLAAPTDPLEGLKALGSHVDTDFLLLVPASNPNAVLPRILPSTTPPEQYHLQAYVLCFPSGFDTSSKFGRPLAQIHAPVPGYETKLQKSMDRYFSTLPPGKIAKRVNWAVQSDNVLFKPDGNHLKLSGSSYSSVSACPVSTGKSTEGLLLDEPMAPASHEVSDAERAEWEVASQDINPQKCMLRSERQTLHRLEKTGALLFSFKTFLYPMEEVRRSEVKEKLVEAIEGLSKGSVPAMEVYKKRVVWGSKVVEYLRA